MLGCSLKNNNNPHYLTKCSGGYGNSVKEGRNIWEPKCQDCQHFNMELVFLSTTASFMRFAAFPSTLPYRDYWKHPAISGFLHVPYKTFTWHHLYVFNMAHL